jgi:predicted transcriptional regulator
MTEISFQLRTLEPLKGAWDILRLFGSSSQSILSADEIIDSLSLSERTFSKAMRRLVTKGYLQHDGDLMYRLTDNGRNLVGELLAYDDEMRHAPQTSHQVRSAILRRMICAVPQVLSVGDEQTVFIGFHAGDVPDDQVEVVVRLTAINASPSAPQDVIFTLGSDVSYEQVVIKADEFTQVRLRLEAYQLGEMGDITPAGGMIVDVPVTTETIDAQFVAYGTDISLIQ